MKSLKKIFILGLLLSSFFITSKSFSQTRLPDGTIVYKDGTRKLPNGTVVYPNGSNRNNTGINRTIDGILHPNRTTTVYRNRYPERNNRQWMPPGQAKKVYGGNSSDYAPGHNKNRRYNNNEDNNDQGNHNRGNGREKDHGNRNHKDD